MVRHIRILAGLLDRRAGSQLYHKELACRLAARGHRVSVVCFGAVPEVQACADVFEVLRKPYHEIRFCWRFASLLQYRHCGRQLAGLKLPPADVVIGGEHLVLKAHREMFPDTPWVYLPHSLVVRHEIDRANFPPIARYVSQWVYGRLQRWALNSADRTLRFTRRACEVLASSYPPSLRPRFVVNPAGVDLPRPAVRVPADDVRLLIAGRLVPMKGVELALTALGELRHYQWRLDVIGEGELRPSLERQAAALGLGDRIRFHGFQADPARWYGGADLLLFPSQSESLGLVLLEAMSHGTPCLGFLADGKTFWNVNDEIIEHGTTGLLARAAEDFRRQLEGVLRCPQQLALLGQAARCHVAQNFTWESHLDRYESLFEELLAESQRRPRRGGPQPLTAGECGR